MRNINSLKNSSQFREVYQKGKSLANKSLVMYVLPKEGDFMLGISVSKKVGNSVIRHKVTRYIRESYVYFKDNLPKGYHIVIVARNESKDKSLEEIKSDFLILLKKHKLLGKIGEV